MCGTSRCSLSHSSEPEASAEVQRIPLSQRLRRGLFCVLAVAALSGCLQGAAYQRPLVEIPADWDELSGRDVMIQEVRTLSDERTTNTHDRRQ